MALFLQPRRYQKSASAGFTLIELIIALAIAGAVMLLAIPTLRSLTGAQLKQSANKMAGLIREVYGLAALNSKTHRIVFDLDANEFWVEIAKADAQLPVEQGKDEAEGAKLDLLGSSDKKYAKAPDFVPVTGDLGEKNKLEDPIRLYRIWVESLDERQTKGRVYLYFFPGGYTQNAQITLSDAEDGANTLTLVTQPLTGEVVIELKEPEIE